MDSRTMRRRRSHRRRSARPASATAAKARCRCQSIWFTAHDKAVCIQVGEVRIAVEIEMAMYRPCRRRSYAHPDHSPHQSENGFAYDASTVPESSAVLFLAGLLAVAASIPRDQYEV